VTCKGKLNAVMIRGKDPIYKIKEQLKIDPTKYRAILFFNGVELENENLVYIYDIKDNSEITVELEEIPSVVEYIPCDTCGESFTTESFLQHKCNRKSESTSSSSSHSRSTNNLEEEAQIPCEICGQFFPFSAYMDHASSCR